MKIITTTKILDLDGNDIIMPGPQDAPGRPMLLRDVIAQAMLVNDDGIDATQKVHRFELAMACREDEVDLSAEDVTLLKAVIGRHFPPLTVGRAFQILDPRS